MNQYFDHGFSTYSVPGVLHISGDDDHRRFIELLTLFPVMQQAFATRIASAPVPVMMMAPAPIPAPPATTSPMIFDRAQAPQAFERQPYPAQMGHTSHNGARALPKRPLRLNDAQEKYRKHYHDSLSTQSSRTTADKERLFSMLQDYLSLKHPDLGADPWIHEIDSDHISSFLNEQAERPAKASRQHQDVSENSNADMQDSKFVTVAPRTLLKKFSDLNHFFTYLKSVAKATLENPLSDLEEMTEAWRARAKAENVHYRPFNDSELRKIFSPVDLLVNSREPDYFWAPLLGLHLGVRLGEVVNRKLSAIGYLAEIDVWYLDVPTEGAKNTNSVRRLPITAPLIELGFLRYVEHVRKLGGEYLFPNQNWNSSTALRDPSKNQSRNFGVHMTAIGLPSSMLVFHSLRHTVVGAMQDAGVPLSQAMQIVGHEAQDHAIKTGRITAEQARSVHLSTYTHADLARLGVQYPILELKIALERSIKPPIDYPMLSRAGDLVLQQLRKVGNRFVAGWAPQSKKYTQKMISRLQGS